MGLKIVRSVMLLSFFATNAFAVAVSAPTSISVPVADADGTYSVTWKASSTHGATYTLEESTTPDFKTNLRTLSLGTSLSKTINGRTLNRTYFYRVKASLAGYTDSRWFTASNGCAVPGDSRVGSPTRITVKASDADGNYPISWEPSSTAGVSYVLEEAANPTFTANLKTVYAGTALSMSLSGRNQGKTFYYRIRAVKAGRKDSVKLVGEKGCAVPGASAAGSPNSINAPTSDSDGTYYVSWGGSATDGVSYQLQEATNPTFTIGLRTAYFGAALSKQIIGRAINKTYYYRVRAVKAGLKDSVWQVAAKGTAYPGIQTVGAPASLTVPASDTDGTYKVSWTASSTSGASYLLEEATNSTFTQNKRIAYFGTALSKGIAGRIPGKTYYYRAKAVKAGLVDSSFSAGINGCAVVEQPASTTFAGGTLSQLRAISPNLTFGDLTIAGNLTIPSNETSVVLTVDNLAVNAPISVTYPTCYPYYNAPNLTVNATGTVTLNSSISLTGFYGKDESTTTSCNDCNGTSGGDLTINAKNIYVNSYLHMYGGHGARFLAGDYYDCSYYSCIYLDVWVGCGGGDGGNVVLNATDLLKIDENGANIKIEGGDGGTGSTPTIGGSNGSPGTEGMLSWGGSSITVSELPGDYNAQVYAAQNLAFSNFSLSGNIRLNEESDHREGYDSLYIPYGGGIVDWIEDLFVLNIGGTLSRSFNLSLTSINSSADLDIHLINKDTYSVLASGNGATGNETIYLNNVPPGRYLIGVSYADDGLNLSTDYTLKCNAGM